MHNQNQVRVTLTREQFEWLRSVVAQEFVSVADELSDLERVHGGSRSLHAVSSLTRARGEFNLAQSVDDLLADVLDSLHGDSGLEPV